jgi:hypothetical protein
MPKESTAPTIAIERIAVTVFPAILDICQSLLRCPRVQNEYQNGRDASRVAAFSRLYLAAALGFEGSAVLNSNKRQRTP